MYFTIFLGPFADTILTEPMPENLQCHLESVWLKKVMRRRINFLIKYYINANNAGISRVFLT